MLFIPTLFPCSVLLVSDLLVLVAAVAVASVASARSEALLAPLVVVCSPRALCVCLCCFSSMSCTVFCLRSSVFCRSVLSSVVGRLFVRLPVQ